MKKGIRWHQCWNSIGEQPRLCGNSKAETRKTLLVNGPQVQGWSRSSATSRRCGGAGEAERVDECQLYCADRLEQTDLYRSG